MSSEQGFFQVKICSDTLLIAERSASAAAAQLCPFAFIQNRSRAAVRLEAGVRQEAYSVALA
jgi:hypothetical protein